MLWLCQLAFFIVWAFVSLVIPDASAGKPFFVGLAAVVLAVVQLIISACQVCLVSDRKGRSLRAIVRESVLPRLPALVALIS